MCKVQHGRPSLKYETTVKYFVTLKKNMISCVVLDIDDTLVSNDCFDTVPTGIRPPASGSFSSSFLLAPIFLPHPSPPTIMLPVLCMSLGMRATCLLVLRSIFLYTFSWGSGGVLPPPSPRLEFGSFFSIYTLPILFLTNTFAS